MLNSYPQAHYFRRAS